MSLSPLLFNSLNGGTEVVPTTKTEQKTINQRTIY